MPSRVIGPQRYGVSDCPVFVAALWRTGENPPPITRDDIESITFFHTKRSVIRRAHFEPVPGLEQLSIPVSCFFNELIQCPDTFSHSGHAAFPYNFLFVSTDIDLIPSQEQYRSRIEFRFFGEPIPEILIFDIETVNKFTSVPILTGELPVFVGSFFAKRINGDGTLTERSPSEVVTDVFRTIAQGGVPLDGQNRLPVEVTLLDPPEILQDENGILMFEYNFEHKPTVSLFPRIGIYDVTFDFFQSDSRIGTANIRVQVREQ